MQRSYYVADIEAGQRVINVLAVPPGLDQTVSAKPRQLLRHRRLAKPQHLFDLADRFFAFDQEAKNQKPYFVRQGLEEFACLARVGGKVF